MNRNKINQIYTKWLLMERNKNAAEKKSWYLGQLRYGDQCAAIGYAFGLKSFEEIKQIFKFQGVGKTPIPRTSAKKQIELLLQHQTRHPKLVLDVGGGRGDVSTALTHAGVRVQMLEPSHDCVHKIVNDTKIKFEMPTDFEIIEKGFGEDLSVVDWDNVDTIIFSESIEHIEEKDFNRNWYLVETALKNNRGLLIIVNWINAHPILIGKGQIENGTNKSDIHCREINDEFYDELSKDKEVIFRQGSHLILRY